MNDTRTPDDAGAQREWDAQEQAAQAERSGHDPANVGARIAQHRLVARVLREPPIDPAPGDFAAQTAARIEARAAARDERVEVWMERALLAALALAGAATFAIYGGQWLGASAPANEHASQLGAPGVVQWAVAVGACIGLSSLIEHWRRFRS